MSKRVALLFTALLVALSCHVRAAQCLPGYVTYVDDGDTAKVTLNDGQKLNVRFYGVDSPEKQWKGRWPSQPFSKKAKQFMTSLLLNKDVCVRLTGDKTYSRVVGEIFVDETSASQSIVGAGLAWWNTKYAPNDQTLARLEKEARAEKRGLWSQPDPEAPWHFRRRYPAK